MEHGQQDFCVRFPRRVVRALCNSFITGQSHINSSFLLHNPDKRIKPVNRAGCHKKQFKIYVSPFQMYQLMLQYKKEFFRAVPLFWQSQNRFKKPIIIGLPAIQTKAPMSSMVISILFFSGRHCNGSGHLYRYLNNNPSGGHGPVRRNIPMAYF